MRIDGSYNILARWIRLNLRVIAIKEWLHTHQWSRIGALPFKAVSCHTKVLIVGSRLNLEQCAICFWINHWASDEKYVWWIIVRYVLFEHSYWQRTIFLSHFFGLPISPWFLINKYMLTKSMLCQEALILLFEKFGLSNCV